MTAISPERESPVLLHPSLQSAYIINFIILPCPVCIYSNVKHTLLTILTHTMECVGCLVIIIAMLGVCGAEQCAAPVLENGVVVAEQNLQKNTFTGTFQSVQSQIKTDTLFTTSGATAGTSCMGLVF